MSAPLRIVLLTTNTSHHLYYAWQVRERFPLHAIWLENRSATCPFDTFHPFERERDAYEREVLLRGFSGGWADLAKTHEAGSFNDADTVSALRSLQPEVVLVFGACKLAEPVIRTASVACLNLHGGNPEQYRGLDTHLWTIYHRDFDNLVTTLHHVDANLDTGAIVLQAQLPIDRATHLHELRLINTQVCLDLSLMALEALCARGRLPARRQAQRGRYYSFMPAVLKADCLCKFERHTAAL